MMACFLFTRWTFFSLLIITLGNCLEQGLCLVPACSKNKPKIITRYFQLHSMETVTSRFH